MQHSSTIDGRLGRELEGLNLNRSDQFQKCGSDTHTMLRLSTMLCLSAC